MQSIQLLQADSEVSKTERIDKLRRLQPLDLYPSTLLIFAWLILIDRSWQSCSIPHILRDILLSWLLEHFQPLLIFGITLSFELLGFGLTVTSISLVISFDRGHETTPPAQDYMLKAVGEREVPE